MYDLRITMNDLQLTINDVRWTNYDLQLIFNFYSHTANEHVIPAEAGISVITGLLQRFEIPTFVGMTRSDGNANEHRHCERSEAISSITIYDWRLTIND
jgi:hypothetical protein